MCKFHLDMWGVLLPKHKNYHVLCCYQLVSTHNAKDTNACVHLSFLTSN